MVGLPMWIEEEGVKVEMVGEEVAKPNVKNELPW